VRCYSHLLLAVRVCYVCMGWMKEIEALVPTVLFYELGLYTVSSKGGYRAFYDSIPQQHPLPFFLPSLLSPPSSFPSRPLNPAIGVEPLPQKQLWHIWSPGNASGSKDLGSCAAPNVIPAADVNRFCKKYSFYSQLARVIVIDGQTEKLPSPVVLWFWGQAQCTCNAG